MFEEERELEIYCEYRDVVPMFSYAVETERRFYLANQVELTERSDGVGGAGSPATPGCGTCSGRPGSSRASACFDAPRRERRGAPAGRLRPAPRVATAVRSPRPASSVVLLRQPRVRCGSSGLCVRVKGHRRRGDRTRSRSVACALALLLVVVVGSTAVTAQTSEGRRSSSGSRRPTVWRAPSLSRVAWRRPTRRCSIVRAPSSLTSSSSSTTTRSPSTTEASRV